MRSEITQDRNILRRSVLSLRHHVLSRVRSLSHPRTTDSLDQALRCADNGIRPYRLDSSIARSGFLGTVAGTRFGP